MSNFGATFKRAREASGLALDKIASETRISSRFLTAIENEDFHLLPGGVFNRGFIRAYAERIGLNPDQALADYDRISVASEEPAEELRNVERASTRRTERNLYPIAAGILLALIAGFYIVTRNAGAGATEEPAPTAPAEQTEVAAAPAPLPPTDLPLTEVTTNPAAPLNTISPVSTAPPTIAAVTPAPATGPANLVLEVDIKDISWVKITADGNVVLSDNLTPGSTRRFTAASSITVSVGNAGGTSLKINGRDLPALGQAGQVRELVITPANASSIR